MAEERVSGGPGAPGNGAAPRRPDGGFGMKAGLGTGPNKWSAAAGMGSAAPGMGSAAAGMPIPASVKTSVAAGLSLGIFMLALESERLAALTHVGEFDSLSPVTSFVSIAVFAMCVALLCRKPLRRRVPSAAAVAVALVCSAGLAMIYLGEYAGTTEGVVRSVGNQLHSLAVPVLLFLWMHRAAALGRTFVLRSFGIGAVELGFLGMLTAVLAWPVAVALVVLLPLAGAALLTMVDVPVVGDVPARGGARGEGACWSALRAVAGRDGGSLPHAIGVALVKLVPFLCYAVIFGNVHFSWVSLQDGESVGLWVQMGASTGSMLCGFLALAFVQMRCGRAFESILHLLLVAVALVALWLSTFLTSGYVFAYLVLLNVAQKLAFMLILLFGFPFARTRPQVASLWALAYYSFFVGTCVSYLTGSTGDTDLMNVVAAVALVVVFAADIAGIASLYGQGGERVPRAAELDDVQVGAVAGGLAGITASDGADGTTPGAGATPGVGEAPAAGGMAEDLAYKCHLIAERYELTRREEEILRLLARGRDAAHVAEALCISPATARTHLRNIYSKLGVHSQQDILDLFEEDER